MTKEKVKPTKNGAGSDQQQMRRKNNGETSEDLLGKYPYKFFLLCKNGTRRNDRHC